MIFFRDLVACKKTRHFFYIIFFLLTFHRKTGILIPDLYHYSIKIETNMKQKFDRKIYGKVTDFFWTRSDPTQPFWYGSELFGPTHSGEALHCSHEQWRRDGCRRTRTRIRRSKRRRRVGKGWPSVDAGGSSSKRGGRALWSYFTDWRLFLFHSVCFSSSSSSFFFSFLCFLSLLLLLLLFVFFLFLSFLFCYFFFQFSPLC